jgi:hypothetical protein
MIGEKTRKSSKSAPNLGQNPAYVGICGMASTVGFVYSLSVITKGLFES